GAAERALATALRRAPPGPEGTRPPRAFPGVPRLFHGTDFPAVALSLDPRRRTVPVGGASAATGWAPHQRRGLHEKASRLEPRPMGMGTTPRPGLTPLAGINPAPQKSYQPRQRTKGRPRLQGRVYPGRRGWAPRRAQV